MMDMILILQYALSLAVIFLVVAGLSLLKKRLLRFSMQLSDQALLRSINASR